jgi:hypothetical protein
MTGCITTPRIDVDITKKELMFCEAKTLILFSLYI